MKKFEGPLAERIKLFSASGSPLGAAQLAQAAIEKMDLLFDHYGLAKFDENGERNDFELAMALACDFVPGLKMMGATGVERRGRRKAYSELIVLISDVQKVREERRCTISEAVHILTTSYRFPRWNGKNKETLENKFHLAVRDPKVRQVVDGLMKKVIATEIKQEE